MECKESINAILIVVSLYVLIETLWNVKSNTESESVLNTHVLIETLWNVKLYTGFAMTGVPIRINRNIVECKAHSRFRRV